MKNLKIFIGSSMEGLVQARHVKMLLEGIGDIDLWDETFVPNKSAYDTLLNNVDHYDFAIMILTADDLRLSRERIELSGRDNVVFEFGLFLGRLERKRAFLLRDSAVGIPSDWKGITLAPFDVDKASPEEPTKTLTKACEELRVLMQEFLESPQVGFLPSTALAIGYFENFLKPLANHISATLPEFEHGDCVYSRVKINVYIPKNLNDQIEPIAREKNWCPTTVIRSGVSRCFSLHVKMNFGSPDVLYLVDLPYTLSTSAMVIDKFLMPEGLGRSTRKAQLQSKELNNFSDTLRVLVQEDSITNNLCEITFEREY